eukprot:TRINITY_DN4561_c0_g1_i1.p1 TRINITY_DN4561_c0_g1~~TRINITY_DN4561_c0_g1_i1.p1  ORF type:complete len:553 (+),score=159.79 TRINITY_DN4561_c0_g1_i1:51-1709(+)
MTVIFTSDQAAAWFETSLPQLTGKKVKLFKQLEDATNAAYKSNVIEATYPREKWDQLNAAAFTSQFQGVKDFSPQFYELLQIASGRHQLMRDFVVMALDQVDHGLSAFDACLLKHSAIISGHYDTYYTAWCKAVQGNKVAEQLSAQPPADKALLNHYTIIQLEGSEYTHVSYATFFKPQLAAVLKAFDEAVAEIKAVSNLTEQQQLYVGYLSHYRHCLALEDIDGLEPAWLELDRLWMDIKYPIQIVHDIEYGYGDPLRVKVIPDFSIRFMDEDYAEGNATIARIQHHMVEYFKARNTDLSNKGLYALGGCLAGIYYLPFQSGMSLHFRFSGQSIPNRSAVKNEKGVKIYFDPVSTASRLEATKALVNKVFTNSNDINPHLTAINTIVFHVAAHEIGHAIYGLDHVKDVIHASTKTLLEEPRAELTALATMKLIVDVGYVPEEEIRKHLASFAVQDLRRFANFSSTATRPYTISAISTYRLYQETGFMKLNDDGSMTLDDTKAMAVLTELKRRFEAILDAEDKLDGATLESTLKEMEVETPLIEHLVKKLSA